MVWPALVQLRRLIDSADGDSVKLAAVKDVLDRTGFKPSDLVAVDNQVHITVSYTDVGMASPPVHRNGHAELTNGQ